LHALKRQYIEGQRWKYLELRPLSSLGPLLPAGTFAASQSFWFHEIDLRPDIEDIFGSFHKGCIQRKLRKAERENLTVEEGPAGTQLEGLYALLLMTRRRHQLPPQPRVWFQNLVECLGERVAIRTAYKGRQPVASVLTLSFKETTVYKYGCSDERFHNLGCMPLLFWRTIQNAKRNGIQRLDLGRSDISNCGLIDFKDHLGGTRSKLQYYRYPEGLARSQAHVRTIAYARKIVSLVPDPCLIAAGKVLYKHMG